MPASEILEWGESILTIGPAGMMPALTALKNGTYLATWVDGSGSTLEAQVVGADNLPRFSKFTVATGGALKNPSITSLADGGFVITWEDEATVSTYAAVFNVKADGTTGIRKAPFQLAVPNLPVNNHSDPSVTALTGGGFAISVTDRFSENELPSATTYVYDSNGSFIRSEGLNAFDRTKDTAITAVQDGNAYVTVVSAANRSSADPRFELTAKLSSASGGGSKSILITSGTGAAPSFAVETLENGRFVVVWSEFNTIKARIFKADGDVDRDVPELYLSPGSQTSISSISVKAIRSGFAVVFQQDKFTGQTVDSDAYLATFTLTGEAKGTARPIHAITTSLQESPALAVLADGRIAVSWKDPSITPGGVQTRIFDDRQDALDITGTSGNDDFYGTAKDDTLFGGNGSDVLSGGEGNDYFVATEDPDGSGSYQGADIFNGNEGDRDKVSYWNVANASQTGIKINLSFQEFNDGAAKGDRFNSIEAIDGTAYDDVIVGDGGTNIFWGYRGNDSLNGGGGNDEINGAEGNDTLDGGVNDPAVPDNDILIGGEGDDFMWGSGGGNDVFDGGEGADKVSYFGSSGIQLYMQRLVDGTIVATNASRGAAAGDTFRSVEFIDGTTRADTIEGTTGTQVFWGAQGADVLKGQDGNDEINGGADNDTLDGGSGSDKIIGETGFDWASYAAAASGVSVSLASGQGFAGDAAGDILVGIEGVMGSRFNDTLAGAAHELRGGLGNDTYSVTANTTVIEAAGQGIDTVIASGSYSLTASAEVEVLTLATPGGTEASTLVGSDTSNTISGNAGANNLNGQGGDDTLSGSLGKDVLNGGGGKDVLNGGTGKDIFVFDTNANGKTNLDKIVDFSVKDDSIWLENKVFNKLGKKGSVSKPAKLIKDFFTVGDKAKGKDDYLIYNKKNGMLLYDADGSGKGKAVEIVTLKKGLQMTEKDFFII